MLTSHPQSMLWDWMLTAVIVLVFLFFTRPGSGSGGFWRRREMTHLEKLRSVSRGPFAQDSDGSSPESPGKKK